MHKRVIVVGAGLSGLTAADIVSSAGCDVVVLEASARLGGRAYTRTADFVDGQYAEAGAEWIDSVHQRVHALIERFGLQVDPRSTTWTALRRWLYRAGRLLGPDELLTVEPTLAADLDRLEDFVAEVADGIADPGRPQNHPLAVRFDAMSVADLVEQLELGDLARFFAMRNMQGEFAAEPREVSVLFMAQQRAVYEQSAARHGFVEAQRLLGGVSGLTDGLARQLPSGTVRLEQPVVSVDVSGEGGVVVRTMTESFAADHVILACSLVALRSVRFRPSLPDDLAAAIAGLGYGTVTKTALQFPSRVWPHGYATTEGAAQRVYEPTADVPGSAGILMAYTGGDGGRRLAAIEETARLDAMERSEREMYANLPKRIAGFSRAWSAEPLFGGSYAVYRPGEIGRFWEVLRRAHGPLHLAGEHAATWTGYLEGAIESGQTVAARILSTD